MKSEISLVMITTTTDTANGVRTTSNVIGSIENDCPTEVLHCMSSHLEKFDERQVQTVLPLD